jgi:RHS repeat-associated protein
MRRTFLSTGSPQTEDQRWYVLQNWRQDVVAIIDEAAVQRERVHYSPYGRVFGMVAGDTGFDGDYGAGDSSAISGWAMAGDPYRAYADVDLDGDIDATDAGYTTNASMGWDVLSRDGSTVGYAGYVQDDYVPTVNHVRHRVLKTDLGRWVQRDPAGYVDGANLYEYVRSQPIEMRDAIGLASQGGCGSIGGVGVDSCGSGSSAQISPLHPRVRDVFDECKKSGSWSGCKFCCRAKLADAWVILLCIGECRQKYPPPPLQKKDWCGGKWPTKYVPDRGKHFNFGNCCKQHDECYEQCLPRGQCDADFCSCLDRSCTIYPQGDPRRQACQKKANQYCAAVLRYGHIFYDASCGPKYSI